MTTMNKSSGYAGDIVNRRTWSSLPFRSPAFILPSDLGLPTNPIESINPTSSIDNPIEPFKFTLMLSESVYRLFSERDEVPIYICAKTDQRGAVDEAAFFIKLAFEGEPYKIEVKDMSQFDMKHFEDKTRMPE